MPSRRYKLLSHNEPRNKDKTFPLKVAHGESHINFDYMASLLEEVVRPQLSIMQQAAARTWSVTLDKWVSGEEQQQGFDTDRLDRLIQEAWDSCLDAVWSLDPRFTLQAIRSIPPEVIEVVTQRYGDRIGIVKIIHLATTAAVQQNGVIWPKRKGSESNWIDLESESFQLILKRLPEMLGGCIGAASLLDVVQGWHRSAGKGKKIKKMPERLQPVHLKAIMHWKGDGIFILPHVELNADPEIEKAVSIYESRRDPAAIKDGLRTGLLQVEGSVGNQPIPGWMWFAGWRGTEKAVPVYIPALDIVFPNPSWYPIPELKLQDWIEQLQPFEDALQSRKGLTCDELSAGMKALGLVIARQTQCCYLKQGRWLGRNALILDSPSDKTLLRNATEHLVSILVRGTLRSSVPEFRTAIEAELIGLRWQNPSQLSEKIISKFTGSQPSTDLPEPFLFYNIDPLTCVLDLSLWYEFKEACLVAVTSGDGAIGKRRGALFEKQVRERFIKRLQLKPNELPWPANREILDGSVNHGDVDFCFCRNNILYNLDMKSWQRKSNYHKGDFFAIRDRLKVLEEQMDKLMRRGIALQHKLEKQGLSFIHRLDFIIVASPEYLSFDYETLWYGRQPRVVTVDELVRLVELPDSALGKKFKGA